MELSGEAGQRIHPKATSTGQEIAEGQIARKPVPPPKDGIDDVRNSLHEPDLDDILPALSLVTIKDRIDGTSDQGESHPTPPNGFENGSISKRNVKEPSARRSHGTAKRDSGYTLISSNLEERGPAESARDEPIERNSGNTSLVGQAVTQSRSEDSSHHRRRMPPVVHEVVEQPVHEIRHKVITRDVHEYDVYHKILPIQEVEVLPPRHFVEDAQGRRREVSADQVPNIRPDLAEAAGAEMAKALSRWPTLSVDPVAPR